MQKRQNRNRNDRRQAFMSIIIISVPMIAGLIVMASKSYSEVNSVQWYKQHITAAKKETAMCNMFPINSKTNLQMTQKGNTMVPISETMAQDCRNANIAIFN